jgi:hypothetical protein
MVRYPIRSAKLADTETLTQPIDQRLVYSRAGLHESFCGELSAPFHLLISLLFSGYQKKRRGGGFLRGLLIE